MILADIISAVFLLPTLALFVYATERVIDHFVQKEKRKERMRIIRAQRRELAIELSKCA